MKRVTPLLLASVVMLAACADQPAAPLAPEAAVLNAAADDDAPDHRLVVMASQRLPSDFAQRVAAFGGTVVDAYQRIGVAVVSGLTDEAAASLQASDDVLAVERDRVFQWLDPVDAEEVEAVDGEVQAHRSPTLASFYPRQWNMRAIGADRAWAAGHLGSGGVTVAILDTGLDYTYPDLQGRVDLARSRSFVNTSLENSLRTTFFPGMHEVVDMNGHGTHVGSTVVSNGHIVAGVTRNVTLIGVKVLSARGGGTWSGVLAGIMYAADAGADVQNLSLGGTWSKSAAPGFHAAFNRAVSYAHLKGSVVVVSAGNSNADLDHDGDGYKGLCSTPTVVCVSATGPGYSPSDGVYEDVDARAPYSNYGRSAIDVAAPGGAGRNGSPVNRGWVWAACSKQRLARTSAGAWVRHICSANLSRNYVSGYNGTSMASPHAAGVAALLVERVGRKQPGLVKEMLHQTADDLGQVGTDPFYGKGRVNAARAVGL